MEETGVLTELARFSVHSEIFDDYSVGWFPTGRNFTLRGRVVLLVADAILHAVERRSGSRCVARQLVSN